MYDLSFHSDQFDLTVIEKADDGAVVVVLAGDLDLYAARYFTERVDELLTQGIHRLDVDCGALSFVDSSGLNALLIAHRDAVAADIEIRVTAAAPQLRELVRMTGTTQLLPGV